ncbi:MAG TPA: hypothetical protein VFL95_02405 [Gemmatimonadales bacterium]|nr:hypothetical protein [Gemmatimonadales bacterium]
MKPIMQTLLANSIDYAGLFPPAKLDLPAAVANYAQYVRSDDAWMLGRFILPASRLEEFDEVAADLLPQSRADGWKLAALAGSDLAGDLKRIGEFNCRHAADQAGAAAIDTLECKAETPQQIRALADETPDWLQTYLEIPIHEDCVPLLAAIATSGARAKVRTGGISRELFPDPDELAGFLADCVNAGVPFKATAGLHHPIRGSYRLTYEDGSDSAPMYGFINLFLATALLREGLEPAAAAVLLLETSAGAFTVDDDSISWQGRTVGRQQLTETRRQFVSFGSCSFREPIDDLRALGLL